MLEGNAGVAKVRVLEGEDLETGTGLIPGPRAVGAELKIQIS